MAHVHGVVVVAAAAVEQDHIVVVAALDEGQITLLTLLVEHPLGDGVAAVGTGGTVGVGAVIVVAGGLLHQKTVADSLQSGVGIGGGSLLGGGVLLVGGLHGVAVGILGGVGSTLEVDVLVVGHVEVVLVLVIVGLHFLVGVGEAVDVVLLIVGGQKGVLQDALEGGHRHVIAVHQLQVSAGGVAGLLGVGGEGLHGAVHFLLHIVVEGHALLGGALLQHGQLNETLLGGVTEVGVPGHVLADTQHHLGGVVQALLRQGGILVNAVETGILGVDDTVIGIVIVVADLGGGIGLALHRDGGGATLDDVGVPHHQTNGDHHKGDGDDGIEPVGAALLGLLLSLTGSLGVCDAAGGDLLPVLLFS